MWRVNYAVACALKWGSDEVKALVVGWKTKRQPKRQGDGEGDDESDEDDEMADDHDDHEESSEEETEAQAKERHLCERAKYGHFIMDNFLSLNSIICH